MARVSNRQIVQELKEGNRLGCQHLVDLYQDRLLGEAVRVFRVSRLDGEELVSDVLLAVVEKIDTFEFKRSDGDFHYWVMTIFRNKVRDFLRHTAITGVLTESFQESAFEDEASLSSTERDVITEILREYEKSMKESEEEGTSRGRADEKLSVVVETLERLETWERVLLRCRALDVPYEEIARYTGKTANQLKVYHGRVKKKFVRLLAEYYPELTSAASNK